MTNIFEDNEAAGHRVWFITDADSPHGLSLMRKVLAENGFVVAVSGRPERLRALFTGFDHALVCLKADITDAASVTEAVDTAISCFGQIDILVNNTVSGLKSRIEAARDHDIRQVFDINLFGLLNVTQCVLPVMRARGKGHVINVTVMPEQDGWGIYNAARRAIDGVSEALSQELEALGIHVTIMAVGDGQAAADAILQLVDAPRPPLRLVLGQKTYERTLSCLEKAQNEMRNWARISLSTDQAA